MDEREFEVQRGGLRGGAFGPQAAAEDAAQRHLVRAGAPEQRRASAEASRRGPWIPGDLGRPDRVFEVGQGRVDVAAVVGGRAAEAQRLGVVAGIGGEGGGGEQRLREGVGGDEVAGDPRGLGVGEQGGGRAGIAGQPPVAAGAAPPHPGEG